MKRVFTNKITILASLLLALAWPGQAHAQGSQIDVNLSTQGREFFVVFMENLNGGRNEIFMSGDPGTRLKVESEMPGSPPWAGDKQLGTDGFLRLNNIQGMMMTQPDITNQVIRITVTDPDPNKSLSVYASNFSGVSSDAALILPVEALGKEYVVAAGLATCPYGGNGSCRSQFAVVGISDEPTEIEIYTKVVAEGPEGLIPPGNEKTGNASYTAILEKGQALLVQSPTFDLSGTIVKTKQNDDLSDECQKFAVFGGSIFTLECQYNQIINSQELLNNFQAGGADHHFEQMKPVTSWGRKYLLSPFQERAQDFVKVFATEDSTLVWVDRNLEPLHQIDDGFDLDTAWLMRGDYIPFSTNNTRPGTQEPKGTFIHSNKPIQVSHHASSKNCVSANPEDSGDPFFVMENPLEQYLFGPVKFGVFRGIDPNMRYYLNVVFPARDFGRVRYREVGAANWIDFPTTSCYTVITPSDFPLTNLPNENVGFCRRSGLEVDKAYELFSPNGQVGFVYGYAPNFESYGYETGAKAGPINFTFLFNDPLTDTAMSYENWDKPGNGTCAGKAMMFAVFDSEQRYRYYTWDFGDGTVFKPQLDEFGNHDESMDGDTIFHIYEKAGTYTVRVSAGIEIGEGACEALNELPPFDVLIDVETPWNPVIEGPERVCPFSTNRQYCVEEGTEENFFNFEWRVDAVDAKITRYNDDSTCIWVDFAEYGEDMTTDVAKVWVRAKDATAYYAKYPDGENPDTLSCWTEWMPYDVLIESFAPITRVTGDTLICRDEVDNTFTFESFFQNGDFDSVRFEYAFFVDGNPVTEADGYFTDLTFDDLEPSENEAGLVIFQKSGSLKWTPQAWGKRVSIITLPYFRPTSGDCISGIGSLPLRVMIYPDLSEAIKLNYASYRPAGQPDDQIDIIYESGRIVYEGEARLNLSDVFVERRIIDNFTGDPAAGENWNQLGTNTPFGDISDENIQEDELRYEYRVVYKDNCLDFQQPYTGQDEFHTVFLEGERADESGTPSEDDEANYASIKWSDQGSWTGTVAQEIWRRLDGQWSMYLSSDLVANFSDREAILDVGDDGVFQAFKIKSILSEGGTVQQEVWSNDIEINFPKEIYGPPIITPNNDGSNDVLYITNMLAHPVPGPYKMVVFNRWNQHIWSSDDYQQDWVGLTDSGNRVPVGTYYYILTDPQGGLVIKGAVAVIWE